MLANEAIASSLHAGSPGAVMIVCVPISAGGTIAPGWGRAPRVAVADVDGGTIREWDEFDVGWDELHDAGGEGTHHARIARFLRDHGVELLLAHHMGQGMLDMLERMKIQVQLGAGGDAREAAARAAA